MNVVHISYAHSPEQKDPHTWLKHIDFFTGILDSMAKSVTVKSIHCISYSGILKRNGVEYHFLDLKKRNTIIPHKIHLYLNNLKPDIVFVHGLVFPWQIILLHRSINSRVKIVAQHHAEKPLRYHKGILQKLADNYIQAYFFSSADLATLWLNKKQIQDSTKIHEVMEVSSTFHASDHWETTHDFNKTYLWIGRLDENKDPVTLIKAFKEFAKTNTEARLIIIFRGDMLIEEVSSLLTPTDNIILKEDVQHEELTDWYSKAAFIVSTSHYEGSGTAVCEAMSCGCIPILSNIPSFRMMTTNGLVGLLFEPGDVGSLVKALNKSIYLTIREERSKVIHQFESVLSFDAIATKMLQVIHQLL